MNDLEFDELGHYINCCVFCGETCMDSPLCENCEELDRENNKNLK